MPPRSSRPALRAKRATDGPSRSKKAETARQRDSAPSVQAMAAGVFQALPPGALQMEFLQRLEQIQGNRSVARVIQRDGLASVGATASVVPAAGAAAGAAALAAMVPADLQAFRDRGPMPAAAAGTTILPSTGWGGFQARYDPAAQALTITMNVGITFVDGMTERGGRAVAAHASLNRSANIINRLPRAARATELARWKWAGDQETWMAGYRSNVTTAWSSAGTGLRFQSSHPGWEAQLANVNIVVNTQDATAVGPAAPGASTIPAAAGPTHCQATIYKTPDDSAAFGAAVTRGSDTSATDQTLIMGSGQTVAHSHLLRQAVFFDRGSVTLNTDARSGLLNLVSAFQTPAGATGTSIDIVGHADTTGGGSAAGDARNQRFSEQRAQAVADFLKATRAGGGTLVNAAARIKTTTGTGSSEGGTGARARRVDIIFAGGGGQNIAAHEFGHMLGMDDQYVTDAGVITGTPHASGATTDDDTTVQATGLGRSIAENNDNVMSLGSTVRAPHMVMFMEALRTVTGSTEWRLKP